MDARQRGQMETVYDRNYINARETLLDAVEALGPHSDAAILVGAQAIYAHTEGEDAGFAVSHSPTTPTSRLIPVCLGAALRLSKR